MLHRPADCPVFCAQEVECGIFQSGLLFSNGGLLLTTDMVLAQFKGNMYFLLVLFYLP